MSSWLDKQLQDLELQRLYQIEDFIESFLDTIDGELEIQGITRAEFAKRLGFTAAHVTYIFQRKRRLNAEMMGSMAFHLGLKMEINYSPFSGDKTQDFRPIKPCKKSHGK